VCKHLKEIVLILGDDLRVSCDSKLSTIQHHEPRSGSEAADVLDTLADGVTVVYGLFSGRYSTFDERFLRGASSGTL
jgi:hypothetical protein